MRAYMKCALCNGTVKIIHEQFEFESKIAGKIIVPNVEYEECATCHDRIISTNEYDKIVDFVRKKEKYLINQQPISAFISAQEAAKILGMSKQAFSKNSRIKRGFIISTKIDNRSYYLKKSVHKYLENRQDGRFLIKKQSSVKEWYTIGKGLDIPKRCKSMFYEELYQRDKPRKIILMLNNEYSEDILIPINCGEDPIWKMEKHPSEISQLTSW